MTSAENANPSIREVMHNVPILLFITKGRNVVSITEHYRGQRRQLPKDSHFVVIGGRSENYRQPTPLG
ncbi:hypothetical protein [Microbacterium panaciterrae]|uniref:Uncharacterized protein n=1 Tax=Microbacterium panaciterrae TaxID=985759 RepID=A0ABP8P6D3_9MICO